MKEVLKKSNDIMNRVTFFFIGMMMNAIYLLLLMKLFLISGLVVSLISIFIINFVIKVKFSHNKGLKAFNLGLLTSNLLFLVFSILLGATIIGVLSGLSKG